MAINNYGRSIPLGFSLKKSVLHKENKIHEVSTCNIIKQEIVEIRNLQNVILHFM